MVNADPAVVRTSSCPRGDAAMARYAEGDDSAFSELYDELAPRLFAFLLRRTCDRPRAEDLLQHTFLHLHRARGAFLPGAAVAPWAFAIARRVVMDDDRARQRRGRMFDAGVAGNAEAPGASPLDELHAREVGATLVAALHRLPEAQRLAYELLREDGLTLCEAAQAAGTTVSAIKSRSHRAYEALRAALGAALGG